jgi:hypothetical protein
MSDIPIDDKPTTQQMVLALLAGLRALGTEPKMLLVHPDDVPDLPGGDVLAGIELQIDERAPVGCVFAINGKIDGAEFDELRRVVEASKRAAELSPAAVIEPHRRLN